MIKKSNKIILSVMVLTLCLATVPMFSMNDENGNCENKKSLVDLATPTANAASKYHPENPDEPDPIEESHCNLYATYRTYILEAMRKYYPFPNKAFPILSPSIMGGLIYEESGFGIGSDMTPKGCGGRSDYRKSSFSPKVKGYHGHGLGQADPSSGDGPKTANWPLGAKVKVTYKGQTNYYVWNNCRDGIFYSVGHLIKAAEQAEPIVVGKLKAVGLNINRKPNGIFVDPKVQKAYSTLILDANNAGITGMSKNCSVDKYAIVNEGCTANKHYGERIFKSSLNLFKCFGLTSSMDTILNKVWDFK
jgi:hypothetical protein